MTTIFLFGTYNPRNLILSHHLILIFGMYPGNKSRQHSSMLAKGLLGMFVYETCVLEKLQEIITWKDRRI